ncbi:MAG: ATP-binding protein [Candidatus Marinimicrobia bacterium]|nr:ATP-binding protein [Candidatus Neomarinimicrobiota bacterium]
MSTNKTVRITNQRDQVDTVRKFFDDYSKENKLTEKTVHDIQMALDELLTNIVNYGYEDSDEHKIDVRFGINDDAVRVEIIDDSKPYNILEQENPDISLSVEDKPIGGLGIFLIKKLMSNVDYYTKEGKNHLVMTKELV